MINIHNLMNFFFITFIINFLVSIYTIYNFLERKVFFYEQGSKLKIKKETLKGIEKEEK